MTYTSKFQQEFLRQGPVREKNKAHEDLEYVLFSMAGVVYPDQTGEYKIAQGHAISANISRNTLGQILASCPNGKTYNLSCALRNANLDYFNLLPNDRCLPLLEKLQPDLKTANKLKGASKEVPIYQIEQDAIARYKGPKEYKSMNALLRGSNSFIDTNLKELSNDEIKSLFISSLLATSGTNKNVIEAKPTGAEEPKKAINRNVGELPAGFYSQMVVGQGLQKFSGLTSFSEHSAFDYYDKKITIDIPADVPTIEGTSDSNIESEILFAPNKLLFFEQIIDPHTNIEGKQQFKATLIHGLVTETTDHYLSELALSEAYDKYLKNPYMDDDFYNRDGIDRPNHALAHHIRVVSYTEPVIDYFKAHAKDEKFKNFCENLSHHEIEIIKVLLAFSKTGRESEATALLPDGRLNPLYQKYQEASTANLKKFMQDNMSSIVTNEEINEYAQVMRNMGDPDFSNKISGTGNAKERKIFINHIVSLAHKLDLPRCYDKEQYRKSIADYIPGGKVIAREANLEHLEKIASISLTETGNNRDSMEQDLFKLSNSDVFYCLDRCALAANLSRISKEQYESLKLKLVNINKAEDMARLFYKRASITSEQVNTLLTIALEKFTDNTIDMRTIYKSKDWTSAQKEKIREFLAKKFDQLIKEPIDLSLIYKIPDWTKEQRQKIINIAMSKLDNLIIGEKKSYNNPTDNLIQILSITDWTEEQRQKIRDTAMLKLDKLIAVKEPYDDDDTTDAIRALRNILGVSGWTKEETKKIYDQAKPLFEKDCCLTAIEFLVKKNNANFLVMLLNEVDYLKNETEFCSNLLNIFMKKYKDSLSDGLSIMKAILKRATIFSEKNPNKENPLQFNSFQLETLSNYLEKVEQSDPQYKEVKLLQTQLETYKDQHKAQEMTTKTITETSEPLHKEKQPTDITGATASLFDFTSQDKEETPNAPLVPRR